MGRRYGPLTGGTLTVIDATALVIKDTVSLGGRPNHIAFPQDGSKAYVTHTGDNPEVGEVIILDTASRRLVNRLTVGKEPHEISLEDAPTVVFPPDGAARQGPPFFLPTAPALANDRRETAGADGVTFAAMPAEPAYLAEKGLPRDHWGFIVQIDSHSADLTGLRPAEQIALQDETGRDFRPVAWQGLSEDSHHRSGILAFSTNDTGEDLWPPPAGSRIRLILRDAAGREKSALTWDGRLALAAPEAIPFGK